MEIIWQQPDEGKRIIHKLEHVLAQVYKWPTVPPTDKQHSVQDSSVKIL